MELPLYLDKIAEEVILNSDIEKKEWFVDGTMFDGGDMVLSCRGIADDEFNIAYSIPKGDFLDEYQRINTYALNSGTEKCSFPEDFYLYVESGIFERVAEDEFYKGLAIIVLSEEQIYAKLV